MVESTNTDTAATENADTAVVEGAITETADTTSAANAENAETAENAEVADTANTIAAILEQASADDDRLVFAVLDTAALEQASAVAAGARI